MKSDKSLSQWIHACRSSLNKADRDVRLIAASFSSDHLQAQLVPISASDQWSTVSVDLEARNPEAAILVSHMFWQIGPIFYQTCRSSHVTTVNLALRNMFLIPIIAADVHAQYIAAHFSCAEQILSMLSAAQRKKITFRFFGSIGETPPIKAATNIFFEWHLVPGVPLFELVQSGKIRPVNDFEYALRPDGTLSISRAHFPVPTKNICLPGRFSHVEAQSGALYQYHP